MKKKKKLNLALVGTESLRSKEIKDFLEKRKVFFEKVTFFDPGVEEEYSKLTQFKGKPAVIHRLEEDSLQGMDIVFLVGNDEIEKRFDIKSKKENYYTIELNETFNMDTKIPLVVSGVNDEILTSKKPSLIANPNPVTIILSHIFHLVYKKFGIAQAISFILRPVSAFEDAGIEELAGQSVALLNSDTLPKKVFKDQIAFNLISHTEKPEKDGFCPIEKQIVSEVKRVFKGREFPLSLSLIQAPVFHTYSIMSFLETGKKALIPDLEDVFKESPYFKFSPPTSSCPVSSISVVGKNEIFIGQIKKEKLFPNKFWIWAVADNLTRGSAINAVEIAEKIYSV